MDLFSNAIIAVVTISSVIFSLWLFVILPDLENEEWMLLATTQNFGTVQYRESLDEPLSDKEFAIFDWTRTHEDQHDATYPREITTKYFAQTVNPDNPEFLEELWELEVDELVEQDRSYSELDGYFTFPANLKPEPIKVYDLGGEVLTYNFIEESDIHGINTYVFEGSTTFDISEEYPEFAPYTVYEEYTGKDWVEPRTGIAIAYSETFTDYVIVDGEKIPVLIVENYPNPAYTNFYVSLVEEALLLFWIYDYGVPIVIISTASSVTVFLGVVGSRARKITRLATEKQNLGEMQSDLITLVGEQGVYILTDKNFVIKKISKRFVELNLLKEDYYIGKKFSEIFYTEKNVSKITSGIFTTEGKLSESTSSENFYFLISRIPNTDDYQIFGLDITEQKQLEKLLVSIDKSKTEFTAMIAHEIRTPIYAAILNLDVLRKSTKMDENAAIIANDVNDSLKYLSYLVRDFFDLQNIEIGNFQLSKRVFQTSELVRMVKLTIAPIVKPKEIELQIDSEDFEVNADLTRIEQVISNIVRNSVDFSPRGAIIIVKIYTLDSMMVVEIEDFGKGITKSQRDLVFSRFYQIDSSQTREHGGAGLGLSVCKGIVEKHGGQIMFDEKKMPPGVKIIFKVPIK